MNTRTSSPNRYAGHGNVTGADNVMSWQTGYPFGVNFSRGFPRFNPGEYTTVDLLARQDVDAALIIATDPASNFPQAAIDHLAKIPVICLDTKTSHLPASWRTWRSGPLPTESTRPAPCTGWTTCLSPCAKPLIHLSRTMRKFLRQLKNACANCYWREAAPGEQSARVKLQLLCSEP